MEKIKLLLKKKNTITKKFGEQSYKIVPYISLQEKANIMEEVYDLYNERVKENESLIPLLAGIYADLHLIILREKTNIDLSDIDYNELLCSGVLDEILSKIVNYSDVKQAVEYMIFLFRIPDFNNAEGLDFEKMMQGKSSEEIEKITNLIRGRS